VTALHDRLPEMPASRRSRFSRDYQLGDAEALLLTEEREIADYYEVVAGSNGKERPRLAANWILNDLMGLQRARGLPSEQLPLTEAQLGDLLDALADGALTARAAKELLPQIEPDEAPRAAAARLDLLVLDEEDAVRAAALAAITGNPAAVADFKGGKKAAIGRLIGEAIRGTGGRANPDQVRRILEEELTRA
jgi:aspartyl-tRNA(Asn)/glutamyl-tRNA(Gln) amidotransferase subunit B